MSWGEVDRLKLISYDPCQPNIVCYEDYLMDEEKNIRVLITKYIKGANLRLRPTGEQPSPTFFRQRRKKEARMAWRPEGPMEAP